MTTKITITNPDGPGVVRVGEWTYESESESDWNQVAELKKGEGYTQYLCKGQSLTVEEVQDDE